MDNARTIFEIREQKRPIPAHFPRIPVHHFERCSHMRSKIDFVDHQQIRTRDPRPSLARDLVAARHIDHVDERVHQFRTEGRRQIVAAALDENQFQSRMPALQFGDRFQIHGSILANRGMRTPAGFDAQNASAASVPWRIRNSASSRV
jgi:hypothetical protein